MSEEKEESGAESSAPAKTSRPEPLASIRRKFTTVLGIPLCLFTLYATNFSDLQEISKLAIFVMFGMVLCFLLFPTLKRFGKSDSLSKADLGVGSLLAIVSAICCLFVVIQTEPQFSVVWLNDMSLGDRASAETWIDTSIAVIGLLLVLECTRRSIGWIVPALAILFIAHAYGCYIANVNNLALPSAILPHAGEKLTTVANTAFLHQGVFGTATRVMFYYVFLFVIFGSFLEISGATQFIIDFSERVFGRSPGGPAKVSVLGSGLMGSLSGSAVANAMTTGAFTIPMMRNAGFDRPAAGGITAAAASGGALVPPVMGAGAYMMLELVDPGVTFIQIARAAIIPSILYYFSLFMIVHFYSRRMGAKISSHNQAPPRQINIFDGVVFFSALAALVGLLLWGFTPFKAVSGSLVVILMLTTFREKIGGEQKLSKPGRIGMWTAFGVGVVFHLICLAMGGEFSQLPPSLKKAFEPILDATIAGLLFMVIAGLFLPDWRTAIRLALSKSAKGAIALVAASACVGIIIAIVDQTGIAGDFSSVIKSVVEENLFVALLGIMVCSIVLGMGVPSVVCYLLMATLMGTLLRELGVIPLGAHLFIFYFGMMSMVTPPVALAAYASASIAQAKIMETAFAAFRFALVGFTLPYMFVYRPALLLMNESKWNAWIEADRVEASNATELLAEANAAWPSIINLVIALTAAILGIIALAAGIAGFLKCAMTWFERTVALVAAALLLVPVINIQGRDVGVFVNIIGAGLFLAIVVFNFTRSGKETAAAEG